jgi:hypothetical protein
MWKLALPAHPLVLKGMLGTSSKTEETNSEVSDRIRCEFKSQGKCIEELN